MSAAMEGQSLESRYGLCGLLNVLVPETTERAFRPTKGPPIPREVCQRHQQRLRHVGEPLVPGLGIADFNRSLLEIEVLPVLAVGLGEPASGREHVEQERLYDRSGVQAEGVEPFQRDRLLDLRLEFEALDPDGRAVFEFG